MGDNGFIYSHHTIINTAAKALSRLTTWSEEKCAGKKSLRL